MKILSTYLLKPSNNLVNHRIITDRNQWFRYNIGNTWYTGGPPPGTLTVDGNTEFTIDLTRDTYIRFETLVQQ